MGWFDEQIKQRKLSDDEVLQEAYRQIVGSVVGEKIADSEDKYLGGEDAVQEIMNYYHVKHREIPDTIEDFNERLEYQLRPYGIMHREVKLVDDWYKRAFGAMLASFEDSGLYVALIPCMTGYYYHDPETGRKVHIHKKEAERLQLEATCFYRPLPFRKLKITDLLVYCKGSLVFSDVVMIAVGLALTTLIGLLVPRANYILMSEVAGSKRYQLLFAVATFYLAMVISTQFISHWYSLVLSRVQQRMDLEVEAASMMRVLTLPTGFFRKFSAGELQNRIGYLSELCNSLTNMVLGTGLTALTSLVYVSQFFVYAPSLVIPALLTIIATTVLSILVLRVQTRHSKEQMEVSAKNSGLDFALLSGVQKIKLAGAEKRAFAKWGKNYAKGAAYAYTPPALIKYNAPIAGLISGVGMILLYYTAIRNGVSVASYTAFNTAYAMVQGAFSAVVSIVANLAMIEPIMNMVGPIMEAEPEASEDKKMVDHISGAIEVNNVDFRYNENMPYVLNDFSLKVRAGEYLAIVGSTGCGKSTLLRLMLGFETPERGGIFYDGQDLQSLDKKTLRRKIGVVMQNGSLLMGSLFENISISAPWLTMDEAWEAAEVAGLADDILNMPMGMQTMITEGPGSVSGGQKQRIMIARAVASKPRIIMLDEATSALDNITQRHVSEAMDRMKCTRIVIAHRLSTIKNCDRIVVMDHGKIIEEGKYEELIQKGGFFAELVERQRI